MHIQFIYTCNFSLWTFLVVRVYHIYVIISTIIIMFIKRFASVVSPPVDQKAPH